MTRTGTPSADPLDLNACFARILDGYSRARRHDSFSSEHQLWPVFTRASEIIRETASEDARRVLTVRWSVGQGRWATVPWIAIMDARETDRVSSGVYVVYLFRGDLSGVYLGLNQGSSDLLVAYKKDASDMLRSRADKVRARLPTAPTAGFAAEPGLDLRADTELARSYEAGSVVHKLYEKSRLPSAEALRVDLVALLGAYKVTVPSAPYLG